MNHRNPLLDPERLKRRRITAGLSQTALAEKAGVTNSHISQVERGKKGFSPANLARLATALDCDIADLMTDRPEAGAA